jgi:hypothetical protein
MGRESGNVFSSLDGATSRPFRPIRDFEASPHGNPPDATGIAAVDERMRLVVMLHSEVSINTKRCNSKIISIFTYVEGYRSRSWAPRLATREGWGGWAGSRATS